MVLCAPPALEPPCLRPSSAGFDAAASACGIMALALLPESADAACAPNFSPPNLRVADPRAPLRNSSAPPVPGSRFPSRRAVPTPARPRFGISTQQMWAHLLHRGQRGRAVNPRTGPIRWACHGVGSVLPRHGPNPLAVPAAIAAVTVSDDDAVRVQDLDRASRLRGGFAALAARAPAAHLQASCATYEAMEVETLDHLRGVWEEDDMVAQQHGCGELRPAYAAELQAHGDAATPASTRGAELQAHGDAAARVHMPWGCSSPAREQHEDNRHGGGRDALARPPGSIDPPPKQSVAA
ncbi:hypothetical protein CYMTET_40087 [Cymbomonas tetramitiformis]|uniref:Uncharacterized protein n=1 Tax=Cymbomonas tetramitiformis TaxID=36881 RepID=A0AAE0F3B7_9CHLO|nr:hypothetical protein CYMTET_40087 [Cymbomonas tetramitiformis]